MPKTWFLLVLATCAFLAGQSQLLHGYALEGQAWPSGTASSPASITMNLQLSSDTYPYPEQDTGSFFPTYGLQDGSPSWNSVAQSAENDWNPYLSKVQLAATSNPSVTPTSGDHVNSVFFASSAFGQGFGSDALAVTVRLYNSKTNITSEADVIVNTAELWDSYRGNLQFNYNYGETIYDIRRVLDHELGHVLGLDHPDTANPPQTVTAIMNSTISNLDGLATDDVAGVMSLYGIVPILEPVTVTANPTNGGIVTGGGNLQIASIQTLTATAAPGYNFVQWDDGTTSPIRSIRVPLAEGSYTATFAQPLDIWNTTSSGTITNLGSVLFVNGSFIAFGSNGAMTSPDGITWTAQTPTTQVNYNPNAIAYHGGTFVSVGASGQIWTSRDGINWTSQPTAGLASDTFNAVTYGDGLFVGVGSTTAPGAPTPVVTSPDGITWTQQTQGVIYSEEAYSSVIYANGMFLAVGGDYVYGTPAVMTSPDGINWTTTPITLGVGLDDLLSVTYGKGIFVAGDNEGYFWSSPDGINWTQGNAAGEYEYWKVTYANGVFLGMSQGIESSTDGVNWTPRNTDGPVYDANDPCAYGDGRFIGVGPFGIYQSGVMTPVTPSVLPTITGSLSIGGVTKTAFNYQITAANSPLAFNANGLPPGLSINVQSGAITGTPTSTGNFTVQLFATNDAGSGTAPLTISVVPLTQSFGQWTTYYHLTGGAGDTPLHDGVPNLLKYLYDIDPTQPMVPTDRAALPAFDLATGGTLTLTYRQNQLLTGVTINVQTSPDLQNWTTLTSTSTPSYTVQQMRLDTNNDPIMEIDVAPTGAPRQFIRLNVTSP